MFVVNYLCQVLPVFQLFVTFLSSFNPSSLLFPLADSGVYSFSSSLPLSTLVSSSSSSFGLLTVAPGPPSVPIFSLHSASSLAPSSLLTFPSASLPPPAPLSVYSSSSFAPLLLTPSSAFPSSASTLRPSFRFSSSSSALSSGAPVAPPSSSTLPPSSSSSPGDFAPFQASGLGLSAEYQALGRWFVASGGDDFPSYLSAHFPHLAHDFRVDFSSGSPRFLAAFASSNSIPTPSSSSAISASVGPSSATPRVPHPPPPAPLPPSVSLPWVPGAPAPLYPPVASAPFLAPSSLILILLSAFLSLRLRHMLRVWVLFLGYLLLPRFLWLRRFWWLQRLWWFPLHCFDLLLRRFPPLSLSLRLLVRFHLLLFHLSLPLPLLILVVLRLMQPLLLCFPLVRLRTCRMICLRMPFLVIRTFGPPCGSGSFSLGISSHACVYC